MMWVAAFITCFVCPLAMRTSNLKTKADLTSTSLVHPTARPSTHLDPEPLMRDIRAALKQTANDAKNGSWLAKETARALDSFREGQKLQTLSIKAGGRTPAVFLTSYDRKYIVKSIDGSEPSILRALWPKLRDYMHTHGDRSLLPRYPTGVISGGQTEVEGKQIEAWSIFRNVNVYEAATGESASQASRKVSALDIKGLSQLYQGSIGGKVSEPGFYEVQDNLEFTKALAGDLEVVSVIGEDMKFLDSIFSSQGMTFADFSLLVVKQPNDVLTGPAGLSFDNTGLLFISPDSGYAYSAAFIDLLSLLDNRQTELGGERAPALGWIWRNNRRALEFMMPVGRLTFYNESMIDLVAILADEHFAHVIKEAKLSGGEEGKGGTNKRVEDLIAMRLLGMAVARRGNTLGLPPTASTAPEEDFTKGLFKMCLEDCHCKIAAKAFKDVPDRLDTWLHHLRDSSMCAAVSSNGPSWFKYLVEMCWKVFGSVIGNGE